jgi:Zn-dependent M32 family carboxypeptidase
MKHLDAYEDMMKNEELKKVFREIDSRFKALIEEVINEGVGHKEEYISLLMEKLEPYLDEFKKELPNKEDKKNVEKSKKKKVR